MGENGWNEEKSCEKRQEKPCGKMPEKKDLYKYEYIPNPYYHVERKDCCCEKDFEQLFNLLLCNDNFRKLLDAKANFGFIGKEYFIGAVPRNLGSNVDNIDTLGVSAVSFDPCNCGFISLPNGGGSVYNPAASDYDPVGDTLKVGRLSLCNLNGFLIGFKADDGTGNSAEVSFKNYDKFYDALDECINEDDEDCEVSKCEHFKCKECCCNESILSQINCSMGGLNITSGLLALQGYDYFGNIGNIAIFSTRGASAGSSRLRFYFICLNSVFGF